MILIILAALCLLSVPLTGGDLRRLGHVQVRWLWLAPLAVVVQTVIVSVAPSGDKTAHALIHIGTYLLIALFLWANRKLAGMPVIAAGALLNGVVILLNGGVMPASATSERLAGMHLSHVFHNSAILAHPHLLWFGDIIPVPWPLPNVLSVGDCIIFVGMLVLLHRVCRVPRPQPTDIAQPVRKAIRDRGPRDRGPRHTDEVVRARAAAAAHWLAGAQKLERQGSDAAPGWAGS